MDKVITYNFNEDFIVRVADFLEINFLKEENSLSRIAVVFGGKRPALFLKKELASRIKKSYFPPQFFSVDNFIKAIVSKSSEFRMAAELDACFIIYNAAKLKAPQVLRGREEFSNFLPWAKEVADFIDELDLEDIPDKNLRDVQINAEIGYEIPESINKLLEHIVVIREVYHQELRKRKVYSRGLLYMDAARLVKETSFDEFERVLFCNLYYLHKTEREIIKNLYERDKAIIIFQKDGNFWPVFEDLSRSLGCIIEPQNNLKPVYEAKIYKGFDSHSQIGLVREILNSEDLAKSKNSSRSLILLSEPNNLIPLLSEISSLVDDFNVSMGYPLKRSSLYNLFQYIFKAQSSRKKGKYYSKDYIKVILHPIVKNLMLSKDPAVTRILCHKVEEMLLGISRTPLSGNLFIGLNDIENSKELYLFAADTLANMESGVKAQELKNVLLEIHALMFRLWEDITNFGKFVCCLDKFNQQLLEKSFIGNYPLDAKIVEKIWDILDEFKNAEFIGHYFSQEDIFRIFGSKLEAEKIAFSGSPLKGLQILELLETRSLTFDNVIVMDANESVLPKLRVYEPLIPRQVMEGLGLKRLRQEEEIQRYHFMRLISGAKKVYFVIDDNPEKEKSRFIEEIIWQEQKEKKSLKVLPQVYARFNLSGIERVKSSIKKDEKIVEYLLNDFTYSASSIDTYLHCPLQFYYQYVLRLKEKEDLLDAPEACDIGDFIHNLLDHTFRGFLGNKPVIDAAFEQRFKEEFKQRFDNELYKRMGSEAFMVKDIMEFRLERFLRNEQGRDIKKILELEEERTDAINLIGKEIKFKYRIDRIDLLEDKSILIIDYKTGNNPVSPAGLAVLSRMEFNRQAIKEKIYSFQLPIYYYFVRHRYKGVPLNAALYSLRQMQFSEFIKARERDSADGVMDICLKALGSIVAEITSLDSDFEADDQDERTCSYCPFLYLCR